MTLRSWTVPITLWLAAAWVAPAEARQPAQAAVEKSKGESRGERSLIRWRKQAERIETLIATGEHRKAYKNAGSLCEDMMDSIYSGENTGRLLALATTLRAISAANLGYESEAIWYWQTAQQLFSEIDQINLELFGTAGELLRANPSTSQESLERIASGEVKSVLSEEGVTPPRKKTAPAPDFPKAKTGFGQVLVIVRVHIDQNGDLSQPLILQSQGELTLVYSALEKMRGWKFHPAEKNGEPIASFYNLTFNFTSERQGSQPLMRALGR